MNREHDVYRARHRAQQSGGGVGATIIEGLDSNHARSRVAPTLRGAGHPAEEPEVQPTMMDIALAHDAGSLLSILDNPGEGVAVADQHANLVYFNPAAERILGLGLTEASASEWPRRYGVFLPDGVALCPAEALPLVRAVRGESSGGTLSIRGVPGQRTTVAVRIPSRPSTEVKELA